MAKKTVQKEKNKCRDCTYARDFHEYNHKGEFFLCKCDFHARSMFVNLEGCDHFKRKSR